MSVAKRTGEGWNATSRVTTPHITALTGGDSDDDEYFHDMTEPIAEFPITSDTADAAYEAVFAPWVKDLGLRDLKVSAGFASAVLPQKEDLQFFSGALCGQAIMAAIDTVAVLAMMTAERPAKGTVSQNTQFLRPAINSDLRVTTTVLRFGTTIAYGETRVTFENNDELVAHSTSEFVF